METEIKYINGGLVTTPMKGLAESSLYANTATKAYANEEVNEYFGKRQDGTNKGTGWLGKLPMQDGSGRTMTEYSAGFEVNGVETEMPTIIPTLTQEELDYLLKGGKPTDEIHKKAYHHGMERIKQGLSPFKNDGIDPKGL